MQIAESQFAAPPGKGHEFVLRIPPSKATAKRCRECGCDVFEHSQSEVREGDVMKIVEVCSDRVPSEINPQLLVGGCFSVMAIASQPDVVVLNCAGTALHAFYPKTRKPFDELRAAGRLLDLEWQDSESFVLPEADASCRRLGSAADGSWQEAARELCAGQVAQRHGGRRLPHADLRSHGRRGARQGQGETLARGTESQLHAPAARHGAGHSWSRRAARPL